MAASQPGSAWQCPARQGGGLGPAAGTEDRESLISQIAYCMICMAWLAGIHSYGNSRCNFCSETFSLLKA
jgi:hypothetical protein